LDCIKNYFWIIRSGKLVDYTVYKSFSNYATKIKWEVVEVQKEMYAGVGRSCNLTCIRKLVVLLRSSHIEYLLWEDTGLKFFKTVAHNEKPTC